MRTRITIPVIITVVAIAITFFLPSIHQNPSYHLFADNREWFGIKNFFNVITNIPFILIGIYGLYFLLTTNTNAVKYSYACMFLGFIFTGIGSGYYHYTPNNNTLVYDRIPMTIVFMSFVSVTVIEYINEKAGKILLLPLIVIGISSVLLWRVTGDLRFYGFVQFYPIVFVLLIYWLIPSDQYKQGRRLLIWVIAWYIIAKLFEHFDGEIFSATNFISGHSLKHLAASVSCYFLVLMFKKNYQQ